MEQETWLKEIIVVGNKVFGLVPSRVLERNFKACQEQGISLEAIANAANELGWLNKEELFRAKEKAAKSCITSLSQEEILAIRQKHQAGIDLCRFLVSYLIGAGREIPITLHFEALDEEEAKRFGQGLGWLIRQSAAATRREKQDISYEEDKDGDRDNNHA